MCNSSKAKQSSTSSYAPTPQAGQAYGDLITQAQQTAQTPYNTATNTNIAGFNPQQLQAFAGINGAAGNYQGNLNQAQTLAGQSAAPINGAQISNYMDPYLQNVVQSTMANLQQGNAVQQSQLTGNAAAQGALGGNRVGVAQAQLAKGQQMNDAQTIAQLQSQGFGQALNAAQTDAQRQLAASGQFSNLAGQTQQLSMNDLMTQLGIGNQQQQQAQNVNNAATTNAQQQTMWPYQNNQWLAGILSGLGPLTGGTSTGNSTTTQGKGAAGILGGGLSLLSMMSDERAKEDISEVGALHDGQKIYKFRYKGDPRFQIGLIAQNVEHDHPEAVSRGPGGMRMVNYDEATRDSENHSYASGGGVGFANSYFPWADIQPARPTMPQLPSASSSSSSAGFDPQKYMQLGKSARGGLDSLLKGVDPVQGWGASVEPANSPSGLGSSGFGSALSKLFSGFAAGGGVPFDDNPFFIDPRTGRVHPPALKDESIGEIGPSSRSGIDMPTADDSARVLDLPDGGPMDLPSRGAPQVGVAQPPVPQQPAPSPQGFGGSQALWNSIAGSDESMPKLTSPGSDLSGGDLDWQKYADPHRAPAPNTLDFNGQGFGIYGRSPPGLPSPGSAGSDSDASSNMVTGQGGTPDAAAPAPEAAAAAGFAPKVETQSAGPGLATNDFIQEQEGFTSKATWDNDAYRNGYGTVARYPGEVIDRAEAQRRLDAESGQVSGWIDKNVKTPLTDQQRAGLTSFGFNLGVGGLQKLLPDINEGNWDRVSQRMLSFNKETKGGRLVFNQGLADRRVREAALVNQTTPLESSGFGAARNAAEGAPATNAPSPQVASAIQRGKDPQAPIVAPYSGPQDKATGGLLKRLFGIDFNPLKLSEDERMGMLQAGLGMMSSGNIGTGGMAGMEYLRNKQVSDAQLGLRAQELQQQILQMSKPQFGVIGTDPMTGFSQYGFADPWKGTVSPAGEQTPSHAPTSIDDFPEATVQKAKNIVAGREPLPIPSKGNPTANAVGQAVRMLDPEYNANRMNFRKGWEDENKFTNRTIVANRAAVKHSDALSQMVDELPDHGLRAANAAVNWWKAETNDPQLKEWQTTAALLAPEIVRVMNPQSGGTLAERNAELEALNPANGRQALHRTLGRYSQLMRDKTQSLNSDWEKVMGKTADAPMLLDDDAKAAYQRLQQRYLESGGKGHAEDAQSAASTRPPGATDEEIIEDAKKALRQGYSLKAVRKRALNWGVDISGIQP